MESQERKKWEALTDDQRNLLLAIVELIVGNDLTQEEFAFSMNSLLEDFPGLEILSEPKRASFVSELWREYEWRRKKEKQRSHSQGR
jgi:hypothetical protein